jgi:hypothetical protein
MFMSVGCSATESVAVMGIGVGTCADFDSLYKLDPARAETMYFGWAQEFLSGWNIGRLADDQPFYNLKSIDADHQQWLIRKYCDQHPLSKYLDAVRSLTDELERTPSSR